jgi:adenylate cyclase
MTSRLSQLKLKVTSTLAQFTLRFEARLLIVIGAIFTTLVISLFFFEKLSGRGTDSRSDSILQWRLSSPTPAKNIVIVDIDERSLALLAPDHGQWPWSRSLHADLLDKLTDAGAKAVLFSVLMSDPDKFRPESDMAMELTSGLNPKVVYPLIRLNPRNDRRSTLLVSKIRGAHLSDGTPETRTIAAVLPIFEPMQQKMGVANQRPDSDGIVRGYPLRWTEPEFMLPSIVLKAMENAEISADGLPDSMTLNWRNKRGQYTRISFVDALRAEPTSPAALQIKNAFVIVGVSAPGIGQTKPTAVNPIVDDNEILATALDDAMNKTYLRVPPSWMVLLLTIAGIWGLIFLAIRRTASDVINKIFVYAQILIIVVMLGGASYLNHLIDLSGMMSFLAMIFASIKVVSKMSHASASAAPGFRRTNINLKARHIVLLGIRTDVNKSANIGKIEKNLFAAVGMSNVIRIDDLLGGNNFLANLLSSYVAFIILADDNQQRDIIAEYSNPENQHVLVSQAELVDGTNIESSAFKSKVTELLTSNAASLFAAYTTDVTS